MAEITYSIETVERMLREYGEKAKAEERERITGLIQELLSESESDAIGKPEYYDYVYIYQGLIKLINKQGKE